MNAQLSMRSLRNMDSLVLSYQFGFRNKGLSTVGAVQHQHVVENFLDAFENKEKVALTLF